MIHQSYHPRARIAAPCLSSVPFSTYKVDVLWQIRKLHDGLGMLYRMRLCLPAWPIRYVVLFDAFFSKCPVELFCNCSTQLSHAGMVRVSFDFRLIFFEAGLDCGHTFRRP